MKRSLALVAIAGALSIAAQTSSLRLVSTAWPPFTNAPGQPRFALDLVEAAFGRIGVSSATTIVEAPLFTMSLLKGSFDGSGAAWKDAEREKTLIFSRPYLENRLLLVGRLGSNVSATELSALAGKRIAIVAGYSYGDVDKAGPTFVRSMKEEDSLELLLAGKVDYTLMDELVIEYIATHHAAQAKAKLQFGKVPLIVRPLHLALRRTVPDAAGIISRFDSELRGMIADRTYHRLLHVEWIRADVDGDGAVELIPKGDETGPVAPSHAYTLASSPATQKQTLGNDRFYVGGHVYNGWNDVPESYKVSGIGQGDPNKSTLAVFRFSWK